MSWRGIARKNPNRQTGRVTVLVDSKCDPRIRALRISQTDVNTMEERPLSSLSIIRVSSVCLLVLLATSAWAQSGSGNMVKVDITMKMQLPGAADMPAQMITQDVCMSSDPDMRAMLQQQKDCAVSGYRKVGNVVHYHVACGGNPPTMAGDARFELLPGGNINGSLHANSNMGGQSVVVDMTYAGVRTGSCDYKANASR